MLVDARLDVFLACIAAVLIVNTITVFAAYKIFANLAARVNKRVTELHQAIPSRQWLASAQTASAEAARVTGVLKDQIRAADPQTERMAKEYSLTLWRTDAGLKLAFRALDFAACAIDGALTWPLKRLHTTTSMLKGVLAFMRGAESDSESDADARPRPNE